MRILFAGISPGQRDRLRVDREILVISREVDRARIAKFELLQSRSLSFSGLVRDIYAQKPELLHVSAHGDVDGCLEFEDDNQEVIPHPLQQLAEVLKICTSVRYVVLLSCYSEQQIEVLSSTTEYLIATDGELPDDDAISFSEQFYKYLVVRGDFEEAFRLALHNVLWSTDDIRPVLVSGARSRPPVKASQGLGPFFPDISDFVSRELELESLSESVLNPLTRVTAIVAPQGSGKSYLAAHFCEKYREQFDFVAWISLEVAPKVTSVINTIIRIASSSQETVTGASEKEAIFRLADCLEEFNGLIVLDALEKVLPASHDETSPFRTLMQILLKARYQSRIVVTSQYIPEYFEAKASLEGQCRIVHLPKSLASGTCRALLETKGTFDAVGESDWEELAIYCEGNPYFLLQIAHHITDVHSGSISDFLQKRDESALSLSDLHRKRFEALSPGARAILLWMALSVKPVRLQYFRDSILSETDRLDAAVAFGEIRRGLHISMTAMGEYYLPPMLQRAVVSIFVSRVCDELVHAFVDILHSHLIVRAAADEHDIEIQKTNILEGLCRAVRERFPDNESLKHRLADMLDGIRKDPIASSGYASSNLLSIAGTLLGKLEREDYSSVVIHQVDLRSLRVHDSSFKNTTFERCAFSYSFAGIVSTSFDYSGNLIAIGDTAGGVFIWSQKHQHFLGGFKDHKQWVQDIKFIPGRSPALISLGEDGSIGRYDVNSAGQWFRAAFLETRRRMYSLDLHPDGEQFVTGAEDGSVDLWNSRTLSHIACLWRHEGAVRCVACCKTSCVIVSASYDGLVRWGSGREGQSDCLNGHQGRRVWSVTFLSGSDVFASGGEDNGVVLWSKGSEGRYRALKKLRAFDEHDGRVLSLGAGSSGSILVAGCADASGGGNNSLYLWKISEGYRKILLEKVKSPVLSIGVHPTEPLLITGNEESTLSVWDTEALTKQKRLDGYNHCLYTISASPRERVACIGGSDGVVRLIDTNEGKCRREYTGHTNRVWSSAFSSDGSRFATGSEDCTIRVWGLDRKESYAILRDHSGRVYSLRFSRDGRFLVSGSEDNSVKIWSLLDGTLAFSSKFHSNVVRSVDFTCDGSAVVSGSEDGSVFLWGFQNGDEPLKLGKHEGWVRAVVSSTVGRHVLSGGEDGVIKLWSFSESKRLKGLEQERQHGCRIMAMALERGGSMLAVAGDDGRISFWQLPALDQVCVVPVHSERIRALDFTETGLAVLSVGESFSVMRSHWTGEDVSEIIRLPRLYENSDISGSSGLTGAEKDSLKCLGMKYDF